MGANFSAPYLAAILPSTCTPIAYCSHSFTHSPCTHEKIMIVIADKGLGEGITVSLKTMSLASI
eukprot:2697084-Ditylum_brightwellii.AAC.1